jgi:hypothetical protein
LENTGLQPSSKSKAGTWHINCSDNIGLLHFDYKVNVRLSVLTAEVKVSGFIVEDKASTVNILKCD